MQNFRDIEVNKNSQLHSLYYRCHQTETNIKFANVLPDVWLTIKEGRVLRKSTENCRVVQIGKPQNECGEIVKPL